MHNIVKRLFLLNHLQICIYAMLVFVLAFGVSTNAQAAVLNTISNLNPTDTESSHSESAPFLRGLIGAHDFGEIVLGVTATWNATFTAGRDLSDLSISITGNADFSLASHSCPSFLAAGNSCNFAVDFTPSGLGERTGTLHFDFFDIFCDVGSDCTFIPDTDTASLSGTGILSPITPSITMTSPSQNPLQLKVGESTRFASSASSANPNFDPNYSWSFPGGDPISSNLQNPGSVHFDSVGQYTVSVTVTDQSNGQSASDSTLIEVTDEGTVSMTLDESDGAARAVLDLGEVSRTGLPVLGVVEIINDADTPIDITELIVVGQGFANADLVATRWTKDHDPDCGGRKITVTLPSGGSCRHTIEYVLPTTVSPGLQAGLLKINTTLGEKIIDLIAKVNGPQTFFEGGRLLNLSTNGWVGLDGMVAGFIVSGTQPRRVVVMGENMQGLADAELMLTDHTGEVLYATNDNWQDHPSAEEIETELRAPGGAQDAAFAITLEQGVYLAWLSDKAGQTGTGLLSITDITAPPGADATRLLNISTNSEVNTRAIIAGFIVSGLESARFVIMGEQMSDSTLNATLRVTDIDDTLVYASNSDWQAHPTASQVEALDRAPGQQTDAAFVVTLEPGVYLAWLESEQGQRGQGLISITEVPAL